MQKFPSRIFEAVLNYLNVSQFISKYISFDIIKSALLFTVVFAIHNYFFIVLRIRIKICRYNIFFLFYKANCAHPKNREQLRCLAHLSAPDQHRARNFSRPIKAVDYFAKMLHLWSLSGFWMRSCALVC